MAYAVGVDVGGTKIAFALVDEHGRKVAEHRLPTEPERGTEAVLDRIVDGIRLLLQNTDQTVTGVGIGCPGVINSARGMVELAVNLNWVDVPLSDSIHQRLDRQFPVWIQNDVKAAVLGERYFGGAPDNFVYIAIGTGLGGSALTGGKLIEGANFSAMEIGHIGLNPAGRLCGCGLRGCSEAYLSGVGLLGGVQQYRPAYPTSVLASQERITTEAILNAARADDPLAVKVISEARDHLATIFLLCTSILNPALFIIGGGLGRAAYDLLCPQDALDYVRARTLSAIHQQLRVIPASIADSTIGAAALVRHYGS